MKKFVFTALPCALILSVCLFFFLTKEAESKSSLVCDENGDFTILAVSDPQCDTAAQWEEAARELETLIIRSNPGMVIICGDMNSENKIPADMWDKFISPITERGIFWSTVNGNHDPFNEDYFEMYKSYGNCLNSTVSSDDFNYEPDRPMNYVLPIYSNDGKRTVFAVYGMDTGSSNNEGYEGLTEKQINWYEIQSDKLKESNNGQPVTSLLCIHIPLPQTIDMYYSTVEAAPAQENTPGGLYKVYGIINEDGIGLKNYICENGTAVSSTLFTTTAPANDRGMFTKILSQNDIKAVLFGHVHRANMIGSYKGVLLGFTGKLSTGCYSDELCRGGRVIKFNQANPEKFTVSWLSSLETSQDQPAIYSDGSIAF